VNALLRATPEAILRGLRNHAASALGSLLGCLVSAIALAPQAFAQGCAMCYQSAAATGDHSRVALQHGILILLFPSVGLFVGIFGFIYTRRNVSR
jgi:hypothetical protein